MGGLRALSCAQGREKRKIPRSAAQRTRRRLPLAEKRLQHPEGRPEGAPPMHSTAVEAAVRSQCAVVRE